MTRCKQDRKACRGYQGHKLYFIFKNKDGENIFISLQATSSKASTFLSIFGK